MQSMCDMVWCRAMSGVKCGDAMWNDGVVHGEYGVLWWRCDAEWFDAILDMVWCGIMVEMQCGMCGMPWNMCCGIVWCVIYIWMWWCAWCGARWNLWAWCGMVCWDVVEWFEVNYGAMWNVVWCVCEIWCDVKCNLNPTNYISTTALVMWNVAGTHTHAWKQYMALNFTHTGKISRVQRRKGGSWGQIEMMLRKIYICYKVWCGMVCLWCGMSVAWMD